MRVALPKDWARNRGPPPPIPYKQELSLSTDKDENHHDSLKIEIETQPSLADSKSLSLYVPIFKSGPPEMLLKYLVVLQKILKGQSLTTGPQQYAMARNLLAGEALRVFNQKATANGTETDVHFKSTTQGLVEHFFPPKALQREKRYLCRGLYKPKDCPVRDFVCRVNEILEYLSKFPPFANNQGLPEDEVIELIEFALPREWQRQMLVQGFDPASKSIQDLVDFCERLEIAEEIYSEVGISRPGENHTLTKKAKTGDRNPPAMSARQKGAYQPAHPAKAGANKPNYNKTKPICPLHGPGHDANSCKVLQNQAKSMKNTYESNRGGGDYVRRSGAHKRDARGEELNALVASAVAKALKTRKRSKGKPKEDADSDSNGSGELNQFEQLSLQDNDSDSE